jgi:integrase
MPEWCKSLVDVWLRDSGVAEGRVFRRILKNGLRQEAGVTPNVVWDVVKRCAKSAGIDHLAPHDLRRYAEFRIMPNRNLRPPEYWVILDRKGECIRHYRGLSNWRN